MILIKNIENVIYILENNNNCELNNNDIMINESALNNKAHLMSILNKQANNNKTKIVIGSEEMALPILNAISKIKRITAIKLKYEQCLSKEIASLLTKNKNLKMVSCYDLSDDIQKMFNGNNVEIIAYKNNSDDFEPNSISIKKANASAMRYLKTLFNTKVPIQNIYLYDTNGKSLKQIIDILKYEQVDNITIFIIKFTNNSYRYNKSIIQEARYYLEKNLSGHNIKIDNYYISTRKNSDLIFKIVMMFISSLVTAVLLTFLYYYQAAMSKYDQKNLKDIYEDMEEQVEIEETEESKENQESRPKLPQGFEELLKLNKDTVGWLTVNNTNIDYPIVQTDDNDYYLDYNFYNERSIYGWPFLDYRDNANELSENNIIYGHYSKNNIMFGSLKAVLNESWYTNPENQIITYNTVNSNHTWQIFSIYTVNETTDYLYYKFSNEQIFNDFINTIKSRSIHDFGVDLNYGDKILTLSTCYGTSDYRLVVHAKLIS